MHVFLNLQKKYSSNAKCVCGHTSKFIHEWMVVKMADADRIRGCLEILKLLRFNNPHVRVQYHIPSRIPVINNEDFSLKDSGSLFVSGACALNLVPM